MMHILHKLFNIKSRWSSLHKDYHAFFENWDNSDTDDHRENESANWICESGVWIEVNDSGSDANTD